MKGIVRMSLDVLLEGEYRKQRAKAAEELYGALADVINEKRPSIETLLYVLESLKSSVLRSKGESPPPQPAEEAEVPGKIGWREARGMEANPPRE